MDLYKNDIVDILTKEQLILLKDYKTCSNYFDLEVRFNEKLNLLGLDEKGFEMLQSILIRYSKEHFDILTDTKETEYLGRYKFTNTLKYIKKVCKKQDFDQIVIYHINFLNTMYKNSSEVVKNQTNQLIKILDETEDYNLIDWSIFSDLEQIVTLTYLHYLLQHLVNMYTICNTNKIIESRKKTIKSNYFITIIVIIIIFILGMYTYHFLNS